MLSFLTPLVLLPCFGDRMAGSRGRSYAIGHTLYVLALIGDVDRVALAGYRKVPLTCPMPGFRDNFLMLCLMQFVGFEVFTRAGDSLEQWMWAQPWRFALRAGRDGRRHGGGIGGVSRRRGKRASWRKG